MNFGLLTRFSAVFLLLEACLTIEEVESAQQVEVAGVKVELVDCQGPAAISVEATEENRLEIAVDPRSERGSLTLRVELPKTGRNTWPLSDVEVLDSMGNAVAVRRGGIQWHKLWLTVPPQRSTFVVHAVNSAGDRPGLRSEKERHATDPQSGLSATISKWHHGRRAALSIRFDDSHPTHLSKAIPILNEYGFRGTFMVNPGGHPPNSRRRSAFEENRARWEAVAKRGDHEFANHTLHHRGAQNDEEMEDQIAQASKEIWRLFPEQSKLLALNLGGGTSWTTTKTLRFYLDRYHLFVSSGSTGMDDVYGNRVATFRRLLENHIERGLWYRVHYHYIGDGLSTSEPNFRAALDIAKENQDKLWIAGMAEIHKYQTERDRAGLAIVGKDPRGAVLQLACSTDPELYDQCLTIELALPPGCSADEVTVRSVESGAVVSTVADSRDAALRFDAFPVTAAYVIKRER